MEHTYIIHKAKPIYCREINEQVMDMELVKDKDTGDCFL